LSAFLDGELPEEEVALLVRRLERDDTYLMTLTSYAAIGGVLRNEPRDLGSDRFRAGVLQAIDTAGDGVIAAPVPAVSAQRAPRVLLATAAAVACFAIVAGVFRPDAGSIPEPAVAVADTPAVTAPVVTVGAAQNAANTAAAGSAQRRAILKRDRMTSYLISHGQQSGSLPGAFGDSRMYAQQASFTE
jgi:negative regulator of sigma E activity